MPRQQEQTRLFPCANVVSLQEARPAAAALSAWLPVSPCGWGATTHLPWMSSDWNILETTQQRQREGEERGTERQVTTECMFWLVILCTPRQDLTGY